MFKTENLLLDSCERNLSFRFESTSFLKNNEYESDFATSLSGIGVMLKPTLEYYLNYNTRLNVGFFGTKFSGVNHFTNLIPIYQIHHKIIPGLELVFGSLYGNLNHGLSEPFYRFDLYYTNNIEYGLQLLHKSKYTESDVWLNWEKFIFEGDPFQEEFTVGNHTKLNFIKTKGIDIKGDLQVLLFHKGGEIDTYAGPAIYIFNGAYGLDLTLKTKHINYSLKPKLFWYQGLRLPNNPKSENYQPYNNGKGLMVSSDVDHKFMNFEFGYWKGEKFLSSKGESLFMSVSESSPNFHQANRKIFYSKLRLKRYLSDNLKLELRGNLYVDLKNDVLPDYSFGLYFIANELFFLKKLEDSRVK